jgi:hypothetical protein
MAPAGSYGKAATAGSTHKDACVDEGRLDPGLAQFKTCAAPPAVPTYLVLGLPICFMVALGILLIGFRGALTLEGLGFLAIGGLGLVLVRYLNRHD